MTLEADKQSTLGLLTDNGAEVFTWVAVDLAGELRTFKRQGYSLLDLAADIGGVHVTLLALLMLFSGPFLRFSHTLKLIKRLYLVKTEKPEILATSKRQRDDGLPESMEPSALSNQTS